MATSSNDFTVVKGKGLHNFSIRPATIIQEEKIIKNIQLGNQVKKPE